LQACAELERRRERRAALGGRPFGEERRPGRMHTRRAAWVRPGIGARVAADDAPVGVPIIRAREQPVEGEDGRRGCDGAHDGRGVVHAEPRSEHAAVASTKRDDRRVRDAALDLELVDDRGIVGEGLLHCQPAQRARICEALRPQRQRLAVISVLREDEQCVHAGATFPHEPGRVDVQLHACLIAAVKEDRRGRRLGPEPLVGEDSLPESSSLGIVEIVEVALLPVESGVGHARTARGERDTPKAREEPRRAGWSECKEERKHVCESSHASDIVYF